MCEGPAEVLGAAASSEVLHCWLGWVAEDPPPYLYISSPPRVTATAFERAWSPQLRSLGSSPRSVTHGYVTLGKILRLSGPPVSYTLQKACYVSHTKRIQRRFKLLKPQELSYSYLYPHWAWHTVGAQ